tara:strand:+ start:442 stop:555 length:114 start_codon:yes stop_codon:yes gene_type:complete
VVQHDRQLVLDEGDGEDAVQPHRLPVGLRQTLRDLRR